MTSITVMKRDKQQEAAAIRAEGRIPGVVYGGDRNETTLFSIGYNEFEKLYQEAGESTLIDFSVDGDSETVKVLIQDVQYEPVKGTFAHVDFKQIRMGEEMQANVELQFVGESQAVREGGTLNRGMDHVTIKCLPKDLVGHFEVDLSALATFDDSIKVQDLVVPEGVTIVDEPESTIATVSAPLTEEQLAAMEETTEASIDDVEVEQKGKAEEGEAAEGEAKKEEPAAEKKAE